MILLQHLPDATDLRNAKSEAYILALIGLAGTLVPVFLSWTKDRTATSQRSQQLDEATKGISFWEQWLRLSSTLGDDAATIARQKVKEELDRISTIVSSSAALIHSEASALQGVKAEFHARLSGLSSIRRLLFFYRPPRALAWFPRIFFYLFSALTTLLVAFGISDYFLSKNPSTVAEIRTTGGLSADVFFVVFSLIVAVGFRYLALSLEKPREAPLNSRQRYPFPPQLTV